MALDTPIVCNYLLDCALEFARDTLTTQCNTTFFLVNCSPSTMNYIHTHSAMLEDLDSPFLSLQDAASSVASDRRVLLLLFLHS